MTSVRVVVADDSEMFLRALHLLLSSLSYVTDVYLASDGQEALRLVEEMQPDILLLDIEMPHLDGWEVLQLLRERDNKVCIVMHTAHPEEHYRQLAFEYGATAFVPKGNVQLLIDTLEKLIQEDL